MLDYKFGDYVTCEGYLKKIKTKHVYPSEIKDDCIVYADDDYLRLDDGEITQPTRELRGDYFFGIIVGKKEVSTNCLYETPCTPYGYESGQVQVTKQNYISCYLIYYGINHSRLVPKDKATLRESLIK